MSTSEILDRTFGLYRNNFLLFSGIAALPAALALIMHLVGIAAHITVRVPGRSVMQAQWMFLGYEFLVIFVASAIGGGIATGATAYAVYHINLGKVATIANSYRQVLSRWLKVIVAAIWVFLLITVLVALAFVGLVFVLLEPLDNATRNGASGVTVFFIAMIAMLAILTLFWVYLSARFAFIIPALLLDKTSVWGAFRRSKFLAKGSKGRIFLILLLTVVLTLAFTWVLRTPGLMMLDLRRHAVLLQLWNHFAQFFSALITGPVATIAVALIYIDQRVRKEAFDLQVMMDAIEESSTQSAAVPVATAPASR